MDKIYTVKEAAKILGFSTNTVYKYLEDGKIQAARGQAQGRFRIPKQSLEEFLGFELGDDPLIAVKAKEQPIPRPTITLPLKISRLLLIAGLIFVIIDLLMNKEFSFIEQAFRIISLLIFFLLAYQFGGFSHQGQSGQYDQG